MLLVLVFSLKIRLLLKIILSKTSSFNAVVQFLTLPNLSLSYLTWRERGIVFAITIIANKKRIFEWKYFPILMVAFQNFDFYIGYIKPYNCAVLKLKIFNEWNGKIGKRSCRVFLNTCHLVYVFPAWFLKAFNRNF